MQRMYRNIEDQHIMKNVILDNFRSYCMFQKSLRGEWERRFGLGWSERVAGERGRKKIKQDCT